MGRVPCPHGSQECLKPVVQILFTEDLKRMHLPLNSEQSAYHLIKKKEKEKSDF
jgi:hypothetical protein